MDLTPERIRDTISAFRAPDRSQYPELDSYTRDELYEGCMGGGGLYLATRMARTMHLHAGDMVLDLGCGEGSASMFLAKQWGAQVIGVDLWTSATFLKDRFVTHGYRQQIVPLHLDVTQELPFADEYFDAVFCMNSFNFYGGNAGFLRHLLRHVKPGGRLCIGSEVLTDEFTAEQLANPPHVYAFRMPPPREKADVFDEDFLPQHTPHWWRSLFGRSGLLEVETCTELEDADVLYEEMVRYEYEHDLDPFDVQISLAQIEWQRTHRPGRTLFVLTARKI